MTRAVLHTIRKGNPDAVPVVLLHAIATNAGLWRAQIEALARHTYVIAVDLPGHGASAPLDGGALMADYADAVVGTLDALGIGRAVFVGLSFGSMVAQNIGARHGARVLGLILSNGVHYTPPPLAGLWQERIADARQGGMMAQVPATLARWFTPEFAQQQPALVAAIGEMVAATSPDGYCDAAHAIAHLDHRDLLGRIAAPTLVVAGEQDGAAQPQAVMAIQAAIAGAQFRILPGAHLVNVEQAEGYTAMILEFVQGLTMAPLPTQEGKTA